MKLSRREREILARIEDDLSTQDPALMQALGSAPQPPPSRPRRLSTGKQLLIIFAPQILIVAFSVVYYLGVRGFAIVTGALVLLWIVGASHTIPRARDNSLRAAPDSRRESREF